MMPARALPAMCRSYPPHARAAAGSASLRSFDVPDRMRMDRVLLTSTGVRNEGSRAMIARAGMREPAFLVFFFAAFARYARRYRMQDNYRIATRPGEPQMQSIVTYVLIALTVFVSWQAFGNRVLLDRLILWPPAIARHRQYDRLVTHGFIHADGQHLLFNMITLFFFGREIEPVFVSRIGQLGFAAFYLSAIVMAIMPTYFRHQKDAGYRSLGASGAVSAVLFSFILFAPWNLILVFFIPVPAIVYAVAYVGYSIWMDRRGGDNVNHSAHLWGAAYGVLFTVLMEPRVASMFMARLLSPSFGG